ncbi:MAG: hypothetical protein ABIJ05_04575 [Patescibacteria group bacterium]
MSIIELIRSVQHEREIQSENEKIAFERDKELKINEAEKKKNERLEFVRQQTERILQLSGALQGLQKIGKELLDDNVINNSISYAPECGEVTLAWGQGFDNRHDGTFSSSSDGHDFLSIEVHVDPDKQKLTIEGRNTYVLNQSSWSNINNVEKALALAYLDPKRTYFSPSFVNDRW